MGSLFAHELASGELGLSLADSIRLHLTSNHFPPVPVEMVAPCIEAIQAGNEGDFDREIPLPEGATWRGNQTAPVWAIIEGHHLDAWLVEEEDFIEQEED